MTSPSARIAELEGHLGIVLSALRYLEEATGETFDDEGGDIAAIEREHHQRTSPQGETSSRGNEIQSSEEAGEMRPRGGSTPAECLLAKPISVLCSPPDGVAPVPSDPTPSEAEASALREALAAVERYDQGLASRYGFLREGGGNDDRMNDIACERIGVGKCVEILKRALTRQSAPAPEAFDQIEVTDAKWQKRKISCRHLAEWIADQATGDRTGLIQRVAKAIEEDRKATRARALAAPAPEGQSGRPADCRFRLKDEGKPYPRSACNGCGKSVFTGLGTYCADYDKPTARPETHADTEGR